MAAGRQSLEQRLGANILLAEGEHGDSEHREAFETLKQSLLLMGMNYDACDHSLKIAGHASCVTNCLPPAPDPG